MVAEIEPLAALEGLWRKCTSKREALFNEAVRWNRITRWLDFCAGVSALLSAFIATAVFSGLISSTPVKVLSSFLAFASSFISLVGSTYANNKKDVKAMYKGAAAFLSIRSKISSDLHKFRENQGQLLVASEKLRGRYDKISKKYDRYLGELPGEGK